MKVNIIAFGIAKDIIGGQLFSMDVADGIKVGELKNLLCKRFPEFEKLRSLAIAINEDYQEDDFVIAANDEVVIIPPVSGG